MSSSTFSFFEVSLVKLHKDGNNVDHRSHCLFGLRVFPFLCNSRETSDYVFTPGKLALLDWSFKEGCLS